MNINKKSIDRMHQIEENRNACKLQLIDKLLRIINEICDKYQLIYVAVEELLSLYLDGEDRHRENYNYKIAMVGQDYLKMTEILTDRYGTAAVTEDISADSAIACKIHYDIASYFEDRKAYPELILHASFPEEAGSKDVTVTLSLRQLSYLPERRKERLDYLRKASQAYSSMHDRLTLTGKLLSRLTKKKVDTLPAISIYKKLKKEGKLLTRYQATGYLAHVEQWIGPAMDAQTMFPVQVVEYGDSRLMIPHQPDAHAYRSSEQLKEMLRGPRLRLLQRFHELCQKHGITYFAVKDLLIEISSEGRYPQDRCSSWSLGLMREDYEKALEILRDPKTADGILLQEYDPAYPQIKSSYPSMISEEDEALSIAGSYPVIELLPYDKITQDYEESFRYKKRVRKLYNAYKHVALKKKGQAASYGDSHSIEEALTKFRAEVMRYQKDLQAVKVYQADTEINKSVPINEILPVQKRNYGGVEISIPYNPYLWAADRDPGYTEYLAQGKTEVLKVLDRICKEEEIPYFATADLLIGAYVYQDVIPLGGTKSFSIGLIRKDYERLLSYLREHGPDYGIQLNESRDPEGSYPLLTKHVTMTDRGEWLMMVRLHPYDKVPASFYTKKVFLEEIKAMNQTYEEMIHFRVDTIRAYQEIYSKKEIEERRKRYASMDPLAYAGELDAYAQKYNEDPQPEGYQRVAFAFSGKVAVAESIRQRRLLPFRDMQLSCLGDLTPWYQPMDEELSYQIRTLQRENRRLLAEFDRVCREIGVGYFLCGGSLLGYIRHSGFIPWDDDVDVGMLRADYDKLLAEGPAHFGEEYFLQTRETDPNIPYVYSKVRINDTEYLTEYTQDRDFHKGIGMDIFPFDYVPNDMKAREKQIKEVTALSQAHNAIARNQYPDKVLPFPARNAEEERIETEQKALIADYWKMSLKDSQQAYLDKATQYNATAGKQGLKTVASFVISYTCINIEDLLPYQRDVYEGVEVMVPKYPHALMSMQYGDYMQPPLLHQQVSHKVVRWSVGEDGSERK